MYHVARGRWALPVLAGLAAALALLVGAGGRALAAQAAGGRQLPIYSVETPERLVALGINCAWDDSGLGELLALLEERGVKATFFLVGEWCERYPQAANRLAQAGHELGSHSQTHRDMTQLDRAQIAWELEASAAAIRAATGQSPRLFRPPSGAYNDLVIATARQLGWEAVQWDVDSLDWQEPPVEEMVERVCAKCRPGSILLWHLGKPDTPDALAQALDRLQGEGYRFCTVGELLYPPPYRLDHTGRQFPEG